MGTYKAEYTDRGEQRTEFKQSDDKLRWAVVAALKRGGARRVREWSPLKALAEAYKWEFTVSNGNGNGVKGIKLYGTTLVEVDRVNGELTRSKATSRKAKVMTKATVQRIEREVKAETKRKEAARKKAEAHKSAKAPSKRRAGATIYKAQPPTGDEVYKSSTKPLRWAVAIERDITWRIPESAWFERKADAEAMASREWQRIVKYRGHQSYKTYKRDHIRILEVKVAAEPRKAPEPKPIAAPKKKTTRRAQPMEMTPKALETLYVKAAKLEQFRKAPSSIKGELSNRLGLLRRVKGQGYYRKPPRGSAPTPEPTARELEVAAFDLRKMIERLEEAPLRKKPPADVAPDRFPAGLYVHKGASLGAPAVLVWDERPRDPLSPYVAVAGHYYDDEKAIYISEGLTASFHSKLSKAQKKLIHTFNGGYEIRDETGNRPSQNIVKAMYLEKDAAKALVLKWINVKSLAGVDVISNNVEWKLSPTGRRPNGKPTKEDEAAKEAAKKKQREKHQAWVEQHYTDSRGRYLQKGKGFDVLHCKLETEEVSTLADARRKAGGRPWTKIRRLTTTKKAKGGTYASKE